ncbi:uncharacterized protein ACIQIH_005513 [Cyanocitta cristata]
MAAAGGAGGSAVRRRAVCSLGITALTLRVCNRKFEVMSGKPKLYYFDGRGKMESIRWLLAAAGVEFEEEFLETREQYEKLLQGGSLLFQQVPMVEIDGMRMVQTRAILSYIAAKYNLYGKDLKERALIDMYVGGTDDLMGFILMFPFLSAEDKEKQRAFIVQKATSRYFPVYEKVLKDHGQDFLVGNNFSWADVHLLEAILMVEEKKSDVLSGFPQLQAFKARISSIPTIKKFLEPGSQRKPVPDDKYVETVRRVLRMYYDLKANYEYRTFALVHVMVSDDLPPRPWAQPRPAVGGWIRLEPAVSGWGSPASPHGVPTEANAPYSCVWFNKRVPLRVSKWVVGITGICWWWPTALRPKRGKVRVPEACRTWTPGRLGTAGAEEFSGGFTRNPKFGICIKAHILLIGKAILFAAGENLRQHWDFFSLIGHSWKLPQAAEFKQPWGTCLCWVESELRLEGNQELRNMSGKPRLTYLNGRGRMEPIRWLLAAAGVEFEEVYLETKEQYDKLIKDGFLLFQQVPLVEIDGMKMVQTRAILSYIAGKYNLYGKDLKERALIDMYVEGIADLMQMILMFPFSPPDAKEKNLDSIKERATNRYFPVFEKVLKQHGQDFLVGNKFSWADVQLMEAILAVEEKIPAVLSGFPQLQAFKSKMSNMPTIKKFLQPGSPRKPPPDAHYVETVLKVFKK